MQKNMKFSEKISLSTIITATIVNVSAVNAHEIQSDVSSDVNLAFDITTASATTDGRLTTFAMELAGVAGSVKPESIGQLTGSKVQSYVWPTDLDPSTVGFDKKQKFSKYILFPR